MVIRKKRHVKTLKKSLPLAFAFIASILFLFVAAMPTRAQDVPTAKQVVGIKILPNQEGGLLVEVTRQNPPLEIHAWFNGSALKDLHSMTIKGSTYGTTTNLFYTSWREADGTEAPYIKEFLAYMAGVREEVTTLAYGTMYVKNRKWAATYVNPGDYKNRKFVGIIFSDNLGNSLKVPVEQWVGVMPKEGDSLYVATDNSTFMRVINAKGEQFLLEPETAFDWAHRSKKTESASLPSK